MKKKQLKKRMKAKKRLTSAAVALLMSGSLLPVGNVFANEQSTQENSISSAEAKADLEKGMAVSGVENSTEAKQETQNTEKTSENSEDDKISIPETAREKRGDAQNASSEVLKKAEPEKSSDGRSILNISNFEQLKSAFNTPNISQVNLSNDIDFSSDITQYTNKNLVINGNGHTLDFRTHRIYATVPDGTCLTVENINTLTTGSTQPYAAFSLCTGLSTITLKDIKHVGTEFAWASNFIFEGNVDININIVGDGWTPALSSQFAKGGGTYKVSKNANVNIRDDINTYETLELTNIESILVESGAKFNIYDSAAKSYGVLHRIKTGFGIYVKEGGEFNIESTAPNTRAIYGPIGSIVVDPGGSINIKSNSDNTIDSYGQTMTIDLRNAKYFNLETTKFAGKAFNVGANSKIMFNSNVYAWNVLSSSIATSGWKDVDGVVELSGRNRTNVSTTNSLFDAQFKPQDYYRISSTGRLNPRIENTTINPVKDTDTAVSGKGEPNGKIEIKVGDQVIVSDTVDSDGNYSLPIPKQNAGTVIKAVVSMDGQTSEANTTVVRTALAQTTISEINTETTQVSGKGEPNAPIKIMNGDQIIAQGVIGSDGNYTLTIPRQAKDSVIKAIVEKDGLTSEAQTTVKQGSLAQTTISEINTETTQVSGKGEPNAPIKIMNGDQIIAQGVIGSDGNYTLTIPKQAKDSVIKAIVEKDGLTSKAQTTVTQGSLVQTTISNIDTNTTSVSGKGEPNAKIELKVGNQVIASGRIGSDGNYSLTIPKQSVGTVVKAVVSANGLTSEAHTTVTRADLAPTTISKVDSQTTVITGTGEPGGKIELLNGNQLIAHGYVGKDGHYSLTVMKQPAGSTIVAKVTMDGKESQASTVVEEKINLQAPVIDKFTEGDVYAKGSIAGDAIKVAIFVNGVQRRVAAVSHGKYSIYAGDLGLKAGDRFEVAGIAADGTIGPKTSATVQKNPVLELTTTIDKFTEGDAYAKGTAGKDATKVTIFVNGVQKRVAAVSNGKYRIYTGDLGLKAGDKFEIAGIAADGTVGPKTSTTVQGKQHNLQAPTIDPYYAVDAYAKGSITGDATKVAIFVNGVQKRVAAVNNGKYSIYTGDLGLQAGDRFEIAGIAADGTIGPKTSATVLENNPEKYGVTAENYILGSNKINGTAKSGIARVKLFVSGHVVRQITVENGKYSIWASDVVTSIGDKVEIIGMDANGVERSRVTVTIMNAPVEEMTLTVNEYTFGENNITGTKSANVSRVQLFVNGVMKRTGTLNGNNFEVYAKDVIVSANDKVEIVGFDKYGNEKRVPVTIKEKEPEKIDLTVNPYKLGDGSITGTVSENVSYVTLNQGANVLKRGEVKGSNFSIWAQGIVTETPGNYTIVAHTASGETKEVPLVVNP
ncbi:hypothetical protein G9L34_002804 [Enterococcus hirae]|nr:hypothetical protein [Enterococcus hirae]EMF0617873.1 hypothetical protein [Enterococcus hirae]